MSSDVITWCRAQPPLHRKYMELPHLLPACCPYRIVVVLSYVRRVAYVEDFYDILHRVHCQERGHVGYKKKKLVQRYADCGNGT